MRRVYLFMIVISLLPACLGLEASTIQAISPETAETATSGVATKVVYADRDEDLHAAWIQITPAGSDVYYYRYNNASSTWMPGVPLTDGAQARNAAISGDYRGALHVVWEEGGRVLHRMWNVTAEIWEEKFVVAENACNPIVICDRSPNAHVIWTELDGEGPNPPAYLSHRYLTSYGEWTNATPFTPLEAYVTEAAVAIDARNGLHAAWKMTFNASKDYDLFYAYRRAGREWGPFERILDGSETMISRPAVAADKDNFAYIVWEQDSETGTDIGFRSWKGSWSDPRIVVDSEGSALNPAILADEGLNLHLVWEDTRDDPGGNPEIYYKRLWPLGVWSSPQRLSEGHPSSEDSLPPRIEVSPRTRDLIVVWTEKGIVYQTIWPGRRREDVTRAASKARAEMAEVQRQPFVSSKAKEKYDQAVSYYDSGVQSLMAFDVDGAKTSFRNVVDVLDEGHLLEEEYKENLGRNMGLTLAVAGIIGGVVVVVPWLLIRNQEG